LAGRGDVGPRAFLERVCVAVAGEFEFDSVTAFHFHPAAEEVTGIAATGGPPPDQKGRRAIAGTPLLAQARERRSLVLASSGQIGEVTSAFALPLVSGDRCLGFLSGDCRGTVSSTRKQ
jgi:hypothetical protein